jgi:hypothetical protein
MKQELTWITEQRKIKELVPLERNPFGKINREKKKRLENKITRLGVFEIPTIDLNNDLLTFNKRAHILVALGRGEETIDVRVPERPLTEDERKEIILASNVHEGEWDELILKEDFSDIDLGEVGVDLSALDADEEEVKQIAEAPEPNFEDPGITAKNQYGVWWYAKARARRKAFIMTS